MDLPEPKKSLEKGLLSLILTEDPPDDTYEFVNNDDDDLLRNPFRDSIFVVEVEVPYTFRVEEETNVEQDNNESSATQVKGTNVEKKNNESSSARVNEETQKKTSEAKKSTTKSRIQQAGETPLIIYECPYSPCLYRTKVRADVVKHCNARYNDAPPACKVRRFEEFYKNGAWQPAKKPPKVIHSIFDNF
uniref:Uncharacterized protein n=1 Tax=Tetranychus urticae TaxID=32264 RepID=T1JR24_TETUR